jgi:hypothetical protein
MTVNFNTLENMLLAKRRAGRLIFESHPVSQFQAQSARHTLDAYIERLGLHSLGEGWLQIDNLTALYSLVDLLYREQVQHQPVMKLHEATTLAAQVLSIFDADHPETLFFTNRDADRWSPLAHGAYDSGVIFLDSVHVGILWVFDDAEAR